MLITSASANSWHWAAWGKHPVARDYFCLGLNSPLVKAFSDWIEKGYQTLGSKPRASSKLCSWRFWAKGPKKETLVCGVGRDSSDSLGRPYPLLIVGTGPLEGWGDHWDLLPFACEKTWSRIEYLSAKRFIDFKQLEEEVRIIKRPYPQWSEFVSQRRSLGESSPTSHNPRAVENKAASLSAETDFFVPLDDGPSNDHLAVAGLWHFFLKAHARAVPNAVFMGGVPDEAYLAVFKRPLMPADFVQLWSLWSEGK
jgi:type VI secretion system protein VasJ